MKQIQLQYKQRLIGREICHYADKRTLITSHYRSVYLLRNGSETCIELPDDGWGLIGRFRLARRALRLDKCNVVPVGKELENLVIIRSGMVYYYDSDTNVLTETLKMRNCRNVLHQSICVINANTVYFGEYGGNPDRAEVPVYRSVDGGQHWQTIFTFPPGSIKHVHGCYWDPLEERVWVLTGDFEGECHMIVADRDFQNVTQMGDGSQLWRACNSFFEHDRVVWIMDTQLEDSHLVIYDRLSKEVQKLSVFPGPVWYIKRLQDGFYLSATACEVGPGVKDQYAHLLISRDLKTWFELHRYRHDLLPKRYFKFGVIGFADGPQSSDSFFLFGEALSGLDGRVFECCLQEVVASV